MKKNTDNNISPINRFNIVFVNIQIILTILVLVFLILSLVADKKYFLGMEIFVGLDLLIMGLNNHLIYKRKNITIMYVLIIMLHGNLYMNYMTYMENY